ncbi:hypothetical protein E2562_016113 [Oryza meyeriana var. granulata]|uniref:Uncharacterized protein n=1 Tax=Oryza meyeriana var. granulata TaxID=110450 RepID=A0A6G1BJY9_9ORYZ|nr:hypothetical protein E2562_016113 [Oryza meyeriana var. granulata]
MHALVDLKVLELIAVCGRRLTRIVVGSARRSPGSEREGDARRGGGAARRRSEKGRGRHRIHRRRQIRIRPSLPPNLDVGGSPACISGGSGLGKLREQLPSRERPPSPASGTRGGGTGET